MSNRKSKNSKGRQPRGQRKTSQRKTSGRRVTGASIVLVELAHHHNSAASAIAGFTRIGLPNVRLLGVPGCGSTRFFAVSRTGAAGAPTAPGRSVRCRWGSRRRGPGC